MTCIGSQTRAGLARPLCMTPAQTTVESSRRCARPKEARPLSRHGCQAGFSHHYYLVPKALSGAQSLGAGNELGRCLGVDVRCEGRGFPRTKPPLAVVRLSGIVSSQ